MPEPNATTPRGNQASRLSRSSEGLHFTGTTLTYRITGLTSYNLDRLRITLKASPQQAADTSAGLGNQSLFHIDTVDLYNNRAREVFAEYCTKYLKAQQPEVIADLVLLISELEAERIAMRERGNVPAVPEMTNEEKKEALEVLKSKDLLSILLSAFDALGYIGEKTNKLLGILAAVSRLLPDPISILLLSRPAAGKSKFQDTVCKLIPSESVIQYTRLTGQSLFYRDSNALKNKVLAIEEEEGMQEAMYSIKTLISSQKLSIAATRTDAKTGKFSVDEYTVYGPVVFMVSTTNPDALDDETRQRFLLLTINETQEQTEQILQAQRTKNTQSWYRLTSDESSVTRLHHNIQRLLRPLTVIFPDDLKVSWPYGRLQMRREQGKFLSLIKALTLLHQFQRKTGSIQRADGSKMDYVLATQRDVDLALELGKDSFARNIDDVSPTGRTLLKHIVTLVNEKYNELRAKDPKTELQYNQMSFSRKELRERVSWSDTQVRRTCEHLTELGYLGRIAGRQGSICRYVLLDTGEDDPFIEFRMNTFENDGSRKKGSNEKSTT
jgi:DNA primase